jgi:isopentenyl phosphate kinase
MIVVKAGGSAITDKRTYAKARLPVIRGLASELSSAKESIVLVNGAGSFGHTMAKKYDLASGYRKENQRVGVCRTKNDVLRLNMIVIETLMTKGIHAVSISPSSCFLCVNGRIEDSYLPPVYRMLELGFVPALYGDVVFDRKMGFCILSGDQIAVYLALKLGAERLILATDVDGLYDCDPKKSKNARILDKITYSQLEDMTKHATEVGDVTGGMVGKLREIMSLAGKGIETDIVNLKKKGILSHAVEGKVRGTRIVEAGL